MMHYPSPRELLRDDYMKPKSPLDTLQGRDIIPSPQAPGPRDATWTNLNYLILTSASAWSCGPSTKRSGIILDWHAVFLTL